ncbi:MAG: ISAzo13 family transposase [Lachnospiraceae bacterium]
MLGYNKGILIEKSTVQRIVRNLGYSRQKNRKMEQVGNPDPDRGVQFEFIHSETDKSLRDGIPVISVDTKKKENIGNFKKDCTEYRASKQQRMVSDHDFFIPELGKIAPYGIYVLNNNAASVNLGTSADTGLFSVESIRRWWYTVGMENFRYADRIVVTCDCGGSNGSWNRLWKLALAELAEEIDKEIEVIHYPPGTSKYNKVEHRLFCYISKHWQGKPLVDVQTVVNLIQSTTTENGLSVACMLNKNVYETSIKVTDESIDAIDIEYTGPHHGWAYIIKGFKL